MVPLPYDASRGARGAVDRRHQREVPRPDDESRGARGVVDHRYSRDRNALSAGDRVLANIDCRLADLAQRAPVDPSAVARMHGDRVPRDHYVVGPSQAWLRPVGWESQVSMFPVPNHARPGGLAADHGRFLGGGAWTVAGCADVGDVADAVADPVAVADVGAVADAGGPGEERVESAEERASGLLLSDARRAGPQAGAEATVALQGRQHRRPDATPALRSGRRCRVERSRDQDAAVPMAAASGGDPVARYVCHLGAAASPLVQGGDEWDGVEVLAY